jgi:hypothetical protein
LGNYPGFLDGSDDRVCSQRSARNRDSQEQD